nr:MAG TPA: hypothetical protein [Bacteriophage sp.]
MIYFNIWAPNCGEDTHNGQRKMLVSLVNSGLAELS